MSDANRPVLPAEAEVDLAAIRGNVASLRALASSAEVMAVVKADAYGHGLVPSAQAARAGGATWLGVAQLAEGLRLRAAGDTGRLLSWLHVPGDDFAAAVAADVDLSANAPWALDEIAAAARSTGRTARVHLKIDTGLSRGGATADEWAALVDHALRLQAEGVLDLVGIWSHLAWADDPRHPTTDRQAAAFEAALAVAHDRGARPQVRHLANSAAALTRPDLHYDLVRPGLAVYGLSPVPDVGRPADFGLRPAMTLRARLSLVKRVPAGSGVAYGHTYVDRARHHARRWCRSATATASRGPPATSGRCRSPAAGTSSRAGSAWTRSSSTWTTVRTSRELAAGDPGRGVRRGLRRRADGAGLGRGGRHHLLRDRHQDRLPGAAHLRRWCVVKSPSRTVLGIGAGLAAAGVGAALGLAAERWTAGRVVAGTGGGEAYGSLRGTASRVTADDGTAAARGGRRARRRRDAARRRWAGRPDVRGDRGVQPRLLPQPGHLALPAAVAARPLPDGVLGPARPRTLRPPGPSDHYTVDQCGADLRAVIEAVAPTGPLVLVGHSMGGMTVMALAGEQPDLIRERVVGVALVATSSGGLADVSWGLTGSVSRVAHKVAPVALVGLTRTPKLVDRTRRIGSDLEQFVVKRYSYASPVPPELVRFTAAMIAATPIDVVSGFLPGFDLHDKAEALAALDGIEALVLSGEEDLLTPGRAQRRHRPPPARRRARARARRGAHGDARAPGRGQPAPGRPARTRRPGGRARTSRPPAASSPPRLTPARTTRPSTPARGGSGCGPGWVRGGSRRGPGRGPRLKPRAHCRAAPQVLARSHRR